MNKIRLIYYIWIPESYNIFDEHIYKIHLYCLGKYSKIFTDMKIIVSMDNLNEIETRNRIINDFLNITHNGRISFSFVQNNPKYREGEFFYNEIVKNMGDFDGLTFFAHSKGFSNVKNGTEWGCSINTLCVYKWVHFMYFMNLHLYHYAFKALTGDNALCYGTFVFNDENINNKNKWFYAGSFQWINDRKLYNYVKKNNIFVPLLCDRSYAENFLGDVIPFNFNEIFSYEWRYFNGVPDPYGLVDDIIKYLADGDLYNEYVESFNELCESIGIVC